MALRILFGCVLVAITVVIHAVSLSVLLRTAEPAATRARRLRTIIWLLIRVTWALVLVHILEITVWGLFYIWQQCLPDAETALYFSGTAYTTIGFGDVVLPEPWRMFGPVEGLTGILMAGLSAGIFVTLVSSVFSTRPRDEPGGP